MRQLILIYLFMDPAGSPLREPEGIAKARVVYNPYENPSESKELMRSMKHPMAALIFVSITCTAYGQNFHETIQSCPDFQYEQYTAAPYISAAIELQNMGRDQAITVLKECCENEENQNRVIILCRMLFEREGEMRRPLIGAAAFPGNTTCADWPAEPIGIIGNIPFLIVLGYSLGGLPESAEDYLEYCELQCTWRNEMYTMPSDAHLMESFDELLNSDKWQTPLTGGEMEFFRSQMDL